MSGSLWGKGTGGSAPSPIVQGGAAPSPAPAPPPSDDPYIPPGSSAYRMMRLVRGNRHARRLRICFGNGTGRSPKWAFVFDVVDALETQSPKVPQSLTIVTNVGSFQVEGFGFERPGGLYEMLFEERVLEIVCFRPGHHEALAPGEPRIVRIEEIQPEEEEGKGRRAA